MEADGHKVVALHGKQEGPERDETIDLFRSGKAKVLITTNVVARGLDVSSVTVVVNYDIPTDVNGKPDPQTYLHRIGRTGRFGRVGVSISFIHDQRSWQELNMIQEYFGVEMIRVPTDDIDEGKLFRLFIQSSYSMLIILRSRAYLQGGHPECLNGRKRPS